MITSLYDCFLKHEYLANTELPIIDYKNPENDLNLSDIYLGTSVIQSLTENSLTVEQVEDLKKCLKFYIEGCN